MNKFVEEVADLTWARNSSSVALDQPRAYGGQGSVCASGFTRWHDTYVGLRGVTVLTNAPLHLARHANSSKVMPLSLTSGSGAQQSNISSTITQYNTATSV